MEKIAMLDGGWGTFLKFKVLTETREFQRVDDALALSGIQAHHMEKDGQPSVLISKPSTSTAFTRAMGYLARVCAASIPFPAGSRHLSWEDGIMANLQPRILTGDRNPNFSLKVEPVKRAAGDTAVAYRVNLSDRRRQGGDMAHVLTCIYENGILDVRFGTDHVAAAEYGPDLKTLVEQEYNRFASNYDDTDVRAVIDAELKSLCALQVLGNTTNFIARDTEARPNNSQRALALVKFIKNCGHQSEILGIDGSDMSRDALVSELRASILAEFEEYEITLDEKLNKPTGERKRGEKQRQRMQTTANENIDKIMALAEYHSTVLGIMADGIRERAQALKDKAKEFLTRDFGLSEKEKARNAAAKQAEEAKLAAAKAAAPKVDVPAAPVPADLPPGVEVCVGLDPNWPGIEKPADAEDPFAKVNEESEPVA